MGLMRFLCLYSPGYQLSLFGKITTLVRKPCRVMERLTTQMIQLFSKATPLHGQLIFQMHRQLIFQMHRRLILQILHAFTTDILEKRTRYAMLLKNPEKLDLAYHVTKFNVDRFLPSWTGYSQLLARVKVLPRSVIGYLPFASDRWESH